MKSFYMPGPSVQTDIKKLDIDDKNEEKHNYFRNTIRDLTIFSKPMIISGLYQRHWNEDRYVTFQDIRPYYPDKDIICNHLCHHLHVKTDDICEYYDLFDGPKNNLKRYVLICRPVIYTNRAGEERGGIKLSNELGVNPVLLANDPETKELIRAIPAAEYIDFLSYLDGRYASKPKRQHPAVVAAQEELDAYEEEGNNLESIIPLLTTEEQELVKKYIQFLLWQKAS